MSPASSRASSNRSSTSAESVATLPLARRSASAVSSGPATTPSSIASTSRRSEVSGVRRSCETDAIRLRRASSASSRSAACCSSAAAISFAERASSRSSRGPAGSIRCDRSPAAKRSRPAPSCSTSSAVRSANEQRAAGADHAGEQHQRGEHGRVVVRHEHAVRRPEHGDERDRDRAGHGDEYCRRNVPSRRIRSATCTSTSQSAPTGTTRSAVSRAACQPPPVKSAIVAARERDGREQREHARPERGASGGELVADAPDRDQVLGA